MYTLQETLNFHASHQIKINDEHESIMHTHQWYVRITVGFTELDKYGISMEFNYFQNQVRDIINHFDNSLLNDLKDFEHEQPTVENVARIMFEKFAHDINTDNKKIHKVELWVNPSRVISYNGQGA